MTTIFYNIICWYFDLKGQRHKESIYRSEEELDIYCNAASLGQCRECYSEFLLITYFVP